MTHVFELTIARTDRAGRLRALLDMGAKTVAVLSDGREERIPVGQLAVGDPPDARIGRRSGRRVG